MRELLEEVSLAEQVGLDVFGVGEHHRPDFVVSAPAVALAAAAAADEPDPADERGQRARARTTPCGCSRSSRRVDLISDGRAEIMAGRGSFIESFPLFGYDLDDYDELFAEKLELLLALRASERVTWSGKHRAPIDDLGVYPRPVQDPLPVWVAVGGSPRVRDPRRRARPADGARDHRRASPNGSSRSRSCTGEALPRRVTNRSPLSINSHGYVAETSQQAGDEFFPAYAAMMNRIGTRARVVCASRARTSTPCERSGARSSSAAPTRWSRRSSSSTSSSDTSGSWRR